MQPVLSKITIGLALTAIAAFAQTKPAFEVATIKPAPPMDMAKVAAEHAHECSACGVFTAVDGAAAAGLAAGDGWVNLAV
jgi:hypothetical protein